MPIKYMEQNCKFCSNNFKKRHTSQKFCSLVCSNRFNLNNKNKDISFPSVNNELAEFFGILFGDGSLREYYITIYLNCIADKGYEKYVVKLSEGLFPGIKPSCINRQGMNVIQLSSRDISDFVRSKGFNPKIRYIPEWISGNDDFSKFCIRGLFDTEGCVAMKYFKGRTGNYLYKQLTFTNKCENLLLFVEDKLRYFGYKPTARSKKNIYISNKEDIERYLAEIGTSNPKIANKIQAKNINGFAWKAGKEPMRKYLIEFYKNLQ